MTDNTPSPEALIAGLLGDVRYLFDGQPINAEPAQVIAAAIQDHYLIVPKDKDAAIERIARAIKAEVQKYPPPDPLGGSIGWGASIEEVATAAYQALTQEET